MNKYNYGDYEIQYVDDDGRVLFEPCLELVAFVRIVSVPSGEVLASHSCDCDSFPAFLPCPSDPVDWSKDGF